MKKAMTDNPITPLFKKKHRLKTRLQKINGAEVRKITSIFT